MSCTSSIRSSESNFKLSVKLVESLATRFNFSVEEAWVSVCDRPMESLSRRFKKERKRNNPYNSVKKPRTSFSFFTQENRAKIAKKNPNASFGDLSKLVSTDWRALTDTKRAVYKKREVEDKERYINERQVVTEQLENAPIVADVSTTGQTEVVATSTPVLTSTPTKKGSRKTTSSKSTDKTSSVEIVTTSDTASLKKPTNYTNYCRKMRPELKTANSALSPKEINSMLSTNWRGLDDTQKLTYA
jgi:hypothetical protein